MRENRCKRFDNYENRKSGSRLIIVLIILPPEGKNRFTGYSWDEIDPIRGRNQFTNSCCLEKKDRS